MCFILKSLDKLDDVYVDHMGITEEDSSEVVLWTDRFVVEHRKPNINGVTVDE